MLQRTESVLASGDDLRVSQTVERPVTGHTAVEPVEEAEGAGAPVVAARIGGQGDEQREDVDPHHVLHFEPVALEDADQLRVGERLQGESDGATVVVVEFPIAHRPPV